MKITAVYLEYFSLLAYSTPIRATVVVGALVVVTLSLSMYLMFKHHSAYKNPESEDYFYVRYYNLQILAALLTNSPNRLQEAILTIPCGITRLMDMLMDREDYLEFLNKLLYINSSNQILLRETMGFDPLISILKL